MVLLAVVLPLLFQPNALAQTPWAGTAAPAQLAGNFEQSQPQPPQHGSGFIQGAYMPGAYSPATYASQPVMPAYYPEEIVNGDPCVGACGGVCSGGCGSGSGRLSGLFGGGLLNGGWAGGGLGGGGGGI